MDGTRLAPAESVAVLYAVHQQQNRSRGRVRTVRLTLDMNTAYRFPCQDLHSLFSNQYTCNIHRRYVLEVNRQRSRVTNFGQYLNICCIPTVPEVQAGKWSDECVETEVFVEERELNFWLATAAGSIHSPRSNIRCTESRVCPSHQWGVHTTIHTSEIRIRL